MQTPQSTENMKWVQVTNTSKFDELLDLFHDMFHSSVKKLAREIKGVLFLLSLGGKCGIRYLEDMERDMGYDNVIAAFDKCLKDKDLDRKVEGRVLRSKALKTK